MSAVIDLCKKLVQFPSINSEVAEILNFLKEYLETSGFSVRLLTFKAADGRNVTNLYAECGSGHPHLLFVGHADVVSAGVEADWEYPPFAATVANGRLYGRGIADMKGGVACFIEACRTIIAQGNLHGKISIIISGDEEEPIVEGTRRVLETLQRENEIFDFALVGEPSNPQTMGNAIKVGRRGDIVLKITSTGETGHTAYAKPADNSACNLVNLLYAMQHDKLDDGNTYFDPSVLHITSIDVGNTATNVVPKQATAVVDIRFNSEHNLESIEAWARRHIENCAGQFELQTERVGEAFLSPTDSAISVLRQIITLRTGSEPVCSTSGGTSDARFVRQYCPVAEYGLTNAVIHKVNESETLENIETLYRIYQDFIRAFCC